MTNFKLAEKIAKKHRAKGEKIVFTNGCFDLLHIGHIKYLEGAKKLGDCLIIGLNSDSSVKGIKGSDRPYICEEERMEVLKSLRFVDEVIIFDEPTPLELIKSVQPDILVKGSDWHKENIVGREFVESRGGKVETVDYILGKSTTELARKIKNS
ncbi:D-glycero-beta-D-manno-heptose 1-phosphate adenylyltransferase [bacterium]|jgi:D-beta-D-heptose 7-phosphate kinase/D-beta-D-heptose 1-phosphate adenosyltransferase|nr:D-glycero-beta-D-manno-heptose 1-phosphate adenylyltransferase [bacterium]